MPDKLYLIPGLGADKRLFANLDLSGYDVHHIEWVSPAMDESIESYAKRLLLQITDPDPIIIGVSFGGMIAVEIGKIIRTSKIILISSARTCEEIPFYFRLGGKLGLIKVISSLSLNGVNAVTCWFFGIKTNQEKELLTSIIDDTDKTFMGWAMKSIVNWKSNVVHNNLLLIQGTSDRLFPFATPDFRIKQGGHFMIYNKAEEISRLIKKILS